MEGRFHERVSAIKGREEGNMNVNNVFGGGERIQDVGLQGHHTAFWREALNVKFCLYTFKGVLHHFSTELR